MKAFTLSDFKQQVKTNLTVSLLVIYIQNVLGLAHYL
jgi:hypothetical protein